MFTESKKSDNLCLGYYKIDIIIRTEYLFLALQIGLIASNDLELHPNGYVMKNTSHIVFQRMCHCMHICISILRNLDVD